MIPKTLITALCTLFFMRAAPAEGVSIPDADLRAAIHKTLDKPSEAPITESEMLSLTKLNVAEIRTLTGLEYATNLVELSLAGKCLTIEEMGRPPALYDGPLPFLHHPMFPLVDVTPLSNLTQLTKLGLENIRIVDVTPLANLKKLTELKLGTGSLTDISPLSELTRLSKLDLSVNGISDVSPLAALTQLVDLDLSGNSILDISLLTVLTHLEELKLENNPLSANAINIHIPTLEANGTEVGFTD